MASTRRCDGCGLTVAIPPELEGSDAMCPRCGARIEAVPVIRVAESDMGLRLSSPRKARGLVAGFGTFELVAGVAVVSIILTGLALAMRHIEPVPEQPSPFRAPPKGQTKTGTAPNERDPLAPGTRGVLKKSGDSRPILVGSSDYLAVMIHWSERDEFDSLHHFINALIEEGDAFALSDEATPVEILRADKGIPTKPGRAIQVRILGGEFGGRTGWIVSHWFHRA